jgi:hypothetical protein
MFRSLDAKSRSSHAAFPLVIAALSLAAILTTTARAAAAGFVHSPNFIVFTPAEPSQEAAEVFAKAVLDRAEQYRKQIAVEWLGEELPPSIGQVMINVSFSSERDSGLTWAKDHPDRKFHALYLTTAAGQMPDRLLAHEIAHCILATKFPHPHRLPAWLDEGIASRYDDAQRQATRDKIAGWYVSTGQWPRLSSVLTADKVHSDDQEAYTLCATLTEMLLARGDKPALLRFGQMVEEAGIDRALNECYGIKNVAELETLWRSSLARSAR